MSPAATIDHPLATGCPPEWASAWGEDEYGPWVEFAVANVSQRMRWIPPGRFLMGSPENEEGRWEAEGPRHEESIAEGFWMFDTPCTQALWTAVMGGDPSHFTGPQRPVEQVSWEDCQKFVAALNGQVKGLAVRLPREEEWECAARAGTEAARYGELDQIAWYDQNSGNETYEVKGKLPNDWGLYDMLGNVWEWCENRWRRSYAPEHAKSDSALRVIRGGGFATSAGIARAAYRFWYEPTVRSQSLGFRCSSSGAGREGSGANGPVERSPGARAEPRGEDGAEAGDRWLNLRSDARAAMVVPAQPVARLTSDAEVLTLRRVTRPAWASGMGRDRFGLWSEFKIGDVVQRLRWIPPGRFLMGSPEEEEGRFDFEGPRHEVVIGKGFWMFDTPCTQALWAAIMGGNPSHFKGPQRPVERVSWDDCRKFVATLNARVKGVDLALPTEERWEYACRAGAEAARYGELDQIAWYEKNSGGQTHDVKGKLPNDWGLYDMLGNVEEWCENGWREGYAPEHKQADSALRVVRGGCYAFPGGIARAASRGRVEPAERNQSLGFRCSSSEAERAGSGASEG